MFRFRNALPAALALALTASLATPVSAANDAPAIDSNWMSDSRVLSASQARQALAQLPNDAPAPKSWHGQGGRLGLFGPAWADVDSNGCDTRNDILGRDLKQADYSRAPGIQGRAKGKGQGTSSCRNATVWSGVLDDPYTAKTISYKRGTETSDAVQIDHVLPLAYVWAHGGWKWSASKRQQIANDPLNLLAVDGSSNQAKGACGPATCPSGDSAKGTWNPSNSRSWWPENSNYSCNYARRFVSVASAYHMGLPKADKNYLSKVLTNCSDDGTTSTRDLTKIIKQQNPKTLLIAGVVLTIVGWLALYMLRSHLGSALGGTKKRSRSRRR